MSSSMVSQAEYARMCGVSRQAINERIKNGKIILVNKKVDINEYPPSKGVYTKAFIFDQSFLEKLDNLPDPIYDITSDKISRTYIKKIHGRKIG